MTQTSAEVVIIGGGVTGLSVALHLKQVGVERVVVLERYSLGAGQSGHAAGIVRALVGHTGVASMLMHSLQFFSEFNERYGEHVPIQRAGYLLLLNAAHAEAASGTLSQAQAAGCKATRISSEEAIELQPGLGCDSGDVYVFEPDAIYTDAMSVTQALGRVARRLGVEIREGCEVQSVLIESSRVRGVDTSRGRILAPQVLVGTAAWGAPMLATMGIELPVYPHRVEMGYFQEPPRSIWHCCRILSDARSVLYLRPEGNSQMFVGWRDTAKEFVTADPDNYWQTARYENVAEMHRRLARTLPFMSEGFIHRSYACVYDHTPDAMPILDSAESLSGLYFSLGFSGGGFSLSPWVGEVMARYMTQGVKSNEMQLLRSCRFTEGDLLDWNNVKDLEVQ